MWFGSFFSFYNFDMQIIVLNMGTECHSMDEDSNLILAEIMTLDGALDNHHDHFMRKKDL